MYTDTGYSQTNKCRWRFLTLHLSAEKTCCPLKCNFLKQDTWTKLGRVFLPSSGCPLLLVQLCESPGQAFRGHFGKHEHPVYFSQIRRGGMRKGEGGGGFVCLCETEGGGGEKLDEGWIERKREVGYGGKSRRCSNVELGCGDCTRKRHKQLINQHRKETRFQTA